MNEKEPKQGDDRASLVSAFQSRLISKLTETSRNNPSLYFRELKSTIELPSIDHAIISALLAGEPIRPAEWRPVRVQPPETNGADTAINGNGSKSVTLDSEDQKRLRALKAKAEEHDVERGLQTLFAGLGLVTWKADDGGRDPLALIFVQAVEIVEDPRRRGEFVIRKLADAEFEFNPSLLEVIPAELRARLEAIAESDAMDSLSDAFAAAHEAFATIEGYTVLPRCVLRTFAFASLALVEDVRNAGELFFANTLALALAGDEDARVALGRETVEKVDQVDLDRIAALDEAFILDADPSQAQAIHTILQNEKANALIQGPPGTGKSQTISNAIAALIANGHRVLFVAEKRAALEVVQRRLAAVGLGHLVLDLHGGDVTRSRVYARLCEAVGRVGQTPPSPPTIVETTFDHSRELLNAHAAFMNRPLAGTALTPFDLIGRLLHVEGDDLEVRFSPEVIVELTDEIANEFGDQLAEVAQYPGLFLRQPDVRWALADLPSNEITQSTISRIATLRANIRALQTILRNVTPVAEAPETIEKLQEVAGEMEAMCDILASCKPSVATLDDATLQAAAAATSSPVSAFFAMFLGEQRAALAKVRLHTLSKITRARLHSLLLSLIARSKSIRAAAPRIPSTAGTEIGEAHATIESDFPAIELCLGFSLPHNLAALDALLSEHARDSASAFRAARARAVENALGAAGAGAITEAIRRTNLAPERWRSAFKAAWLRSHLDRVYSTVATFDGRQHDRTVAQFADLDRTRLRTAVGRIARSAAARFIELSRTYPAELTAFRVELNRTRKQKAIRELYAAAPNLLPSLVPCVMASPLSVSQLLPRLRLFDVVIFDEGSQILPESAINAALRGSRLVVAGDEHQLPPTTFFQSTDDEDEEEEPTDALVGTESILDSIKSFATTLSLDVHYRSSDERLIAFSNHWIYGDRLITFPGSGGRGAALSHVYVDEPLRDGDETSSSAEARRVVELIIEHAEKRPDESLGVIAMGVKHARRIEAELQRVRHERRDLDDFFAEGREEKMFIKNLERVQGDERDAIILSIGYGRTKTGAITHNFGPVNNSGGERRLNVAITRAKHRLTLVSSFRSTDLDPTRLSKVGPKLLARYVRYAESGGDDLGRDRAHEDVELNAFELDVKTTLERRLGMQIIGQFGVGQYRIDLVVQDPRAPGAYLLAIECDGASYHSTPTARMRDRLRQQILEARGWRFIRVWSTDWFERRDAEIERIASAYAAALEARSNNPHFSEVDISGELSPRAGQVVASFPERRGRQPVLSGTPIEQILESEMVRLLRWIESDGRLRTDEQLFEATYSHLGYSRRGSRIVKSIMLAITQLREKF